MYLTTLLFWATLVGYMVGFGCKNRPKPTMYQTKAVQKCGLVHGWRPPTLSRLSGVVGAGSEPERPGQGGVIGHRTSGECGGGPRGVEGLSRAPAVVGVLGTSGVGLARGSGDGPSRGCGCGDGLLRGCGDELLRGCGCGDGLLRGCADGLLRGCGAELLRGGARAGAAGVGGVAPRQGSELDWAPVQLLDCQPPDSQPPDSQPPGSQPPDCQRSCSCWCCQPPGCQLPDCQPPHCCCVCCRAAAAVSRRRFCCRAAAGAAGAVVVLGVGWWKEVTFIFFI